ncbi:MAG: ATP-binding protein [Acidimicrobiia bacterium]|nr:ATP-binding protein [Acidimicrobiia bacterium]
MDTVTVVAIGVAVVALVVAAIALTARNRYAAAVDATLTRIGPAEGDGGRGARVLRLAEALDELERSLARAQRTRAQLAGALEAAEIGILITDDRGEVTFSNESARRYLGARHGEAVAEVRIREAIDEAVLGRAPVEREEELFTPRRRVLKLLAVPLEFGVESAGAVAYIIDVTEERRVEAMRRDFIANVSHELKTPLGALAVLAETLAANIEDPAIALRFADRLAGEATRLSKLLEDILDLSQAEARSAAFEPVPFERVVGDVSTGLFERAEERGVELVLHPVPAEAVVEGDRRQLRSLVHNIVDNAIKYSEPERGDPAPRVEVRVVAESDVVVLEVADQGIGIPDGHLDRIFERFYRVDRARSRATGGTGLGLSIVRHVTLNHGGTVAVDSRHGEGTTFTVRLPRSEAR